jgi:chemotaxis protein MotB
MARMHSWIGLAAFGFILTGCISQEKYTALRMERDRYAEQLAQAQSDASSARAEAEAYRQQINSLMAVGPNRDALVNNLTAQNTELQRQLEELNRRYAEAVGRMGQTGLALPPALSNELSNFARQNPDLVEFDAARGIVKFKSDVTFALGDATLTTPARDAINRFAAILNSPAASGYELMVAGHTDNTRVVNPQTIAKGHKDNWYLSAHRAISVGQELQNHRINPQRLAVVGYADQRPSASNSSESGRAQNRRVEVLILPTTVRGGSAVTDSTPAAAPVQRSSQPTATTDNNPALNK